MYLPSLECHLKCPLSGLLERLEYFEEAVKLSLSCKLCITSEMYECSKGLLNHFENDHPELLTELETSSTETQTPRKPTEADSRAPSAKKRGRPRKTTINEEEYVIQHDQNAEDSAVKQENISEVEMEQTAEATPLEQYLPNETSYVTTDELHVNVMILDDVNDVNTAHQSSKKRKLQDNAEDTNESWNTERVDDYCGPEDEGLSDSACTDAVSSTTYDDTQGNEDAEDEQELDDDWGLYYPESVKTCCVCGERCPSTAHWWKHMRKTHPTEPLYACGQCDKKFFSKQLEVKHRRAMQHLKFTCYMCRNVFEGEETLKSHQKDHPLTNCKVCGTSVRNFYNHLVTVHNKSFFKCEQCDKRFNTKRKLQNHLAVHTDERPFECNECDKAFKTKSQRYNHFRSVHTSTNLPCTTCGKSFSSKASLRLHELKHKNIRPFMCDLCGAKFNDPSVLNRHVKHLHTDTKGPTCTVCNKQLRDNTSLTHHMRTHTGERNFSCNVCGMAFARKDVLETHSRRHTGAMPFKCETCDRMFRHKSSYYNHMKQHGSTDSSVNSSPYRGRIAQSACDIKSDNASFEQKYEVGAGDVHVQGTTYQVAYEGVPGELIETVATEYQEYSASLDPASLEQAAASGTIEIPGSVIEGQADNYIIEQIQ